MYEDVQLICFIHRCITCSLPSPYMDVSLHASLGSLHGSFLICLLVEDSDVALLAYLESWPCVAGRWQQLQSCQDMASTRVGDAFRLLHGVDV